MSVIFFLQNFGHMENVQHFSGLQFYIEGVVLCWLSETWWHYHRSLLHRSNWRRSHCVKREEMRKVEPQDVVSSGQHMCTHIISSIGSHKKFRTFELSYSVTIFTI